MDLIHVSLMINKQTGGVLGTFQLGGHLGVSIEFRDKRPFGPFEMKSSRKLNFTFHMDLFHVSLMINKQTGGEREGKEKAKKRKGRERRARLMNYPFQKQVSII